MARPGWSTMLRKGSREERLTSTLRYIGNAFLVLGHFVLLWGDTATALTFKLTGGISILPFAFAWKLWDVIALEMLFICLDSTKLYQVLFS